MKGGVAAMFVVGMRNKREKEQEQEESNFFLLVQVTSERSGSCLHNTLITLLFVIYSVAIKKGDGKLIIHFVLRTLSFHRLKGIIEKFHQINLLFIFIFIITTSIFGTSALNNPVYDLDDQAEPVYHNDI